MTDNDIKNNVSNSGGGGVVFLGNNTVDKQVLRYNRFENNLDNGILNHIYNEGTQSTPNIDAENNWWGSNDPTAIESSIYHFADDPNRGVVDFDPFCNQPCVPVQSTPTTSPTVPPTNTPTSTPTPPLGNPVQQVTISGPTEGDLNTSVTFSATISPATVAGTITYSWQINSQLDAEHVNSALLDTYTKAWNIPGLYRLTVTAHTSASTSSDTHVINIHASTAPTQPWLIMIYLNGDNNLDGETEELFNRLEKAVAGDPTLTVRVLWDRSRNGDTVLYHVLPDDKPFILSPVYQEGKTKFTKNELDMGSKETLLDFITTTRQEFPTYYHLLSIVDHGGGWSPPIPDPLKSGYRYVAGGSGFSWDDTNGYHYLSTKDVGYIFNQPSLTNDPIDLVFYDACLMAMLEEAYEIHNGAHLLLASQYLAWSSFPYDTYLQGIHSRVPEAQARWMVEQYHQSLLQVGLAHSLSLFDLSQAPTVITALDDLAQKLDSQLSTLRPVIKNVFTTTQKLDMNGDSLIQPMEGYIDLRDFAEKLAGAVPGTEVAAAAQRLTAALSGEEKLILAEQHASGKNRAFGYGQDVKLEKLFGISLYFPIGDLVQIDPDLSAYTPGNLSLAQHTHWDNFIFNFLGLTSQGPGQDFVGGRGNPINPLSSDVQVFLPILRR